MTKPVFYDACVGARILQLRSLIGLSQRELAKRAGMTNSVISTIEQDKVSPSVSSLAKLLSGLGLSLSEFFSLSFAPSISLSLEVPRLMQQPILLAPGAVTDLAVVAQTGDNIACVSGEVLVRSLNGSQRLAPGESYYVPPFGVYVLVNEGVGEASLWLASLS
jgi:transcriptional regulator with XRE-family HTH domain